jgi:hypothetical protein
MAGIVGDDVRLEQRPGLRERLDVGAFELAVAVGALLDLTTTTYILLTGKAEANLVIKRLAAVDPWLAIGVFWAFGAVLVGTTWVADDWLARPAGAYTLVSLGMAGTFNVILYTTGVYLMPVDPAWYIHHVAPALGVGIGALWLTVADEVPWRNVAVAGGGFVGAAWLLPFAF